MKKVLVIEDNEQNMYLFEFMLRKHGYEVIKAWDGEEGVIQAKEKKPDLIIMDWNMPKKNGLEATIEIRQIEGLKEVPILFCTSNVMAGDREKAFSVGASGYLEKPINPDTFIAEIRKYTSE